MDADSLSNYVLKTIPALEEKVVFLVDKLGNAYKLLAEHKRVIEELAEKAGIEVKPSTAELEGPSAAIEKLTTEQEQNAAKQREIEELQREEAELHEAQMRLQAKKAAAQRAA